MMFRGAQCVLPLHPLTDHTTHTSSLKHHEDTMTIKNLAYNGFLKIVTVLTPNGNTREVMERGESACVLIVDPETHKMLVIKEERAGVVLRDHKNNTPSDGMQFGPIAGMIDSGETPLQTIIREAKEEANIIIDPYDDEIIGPVSLYASPGGSSEVIHHFVVYKAIDPALHGTTGGCADENETTLVHILEFDDPNLFPEEFHPINALLWTCLSLHEQNDMG